MARGLNPGNKVDPSNPSMGTGKCKTPHDNLHVNNKVVGGDLRGGGYKGKTSPGGIMSIPEHYQTQNGETHKDPNKRAKVTGGK